MKEGRSLLQLAEELERQKETMKDYLVDTRRIVMEEANNGASALRIEGSDRAPALVSDIAHRQIGSYLGISAAYYDKMRAEYPDLLQQNVNGWFHKDPATRMVRTLDGRARAFLSDRYRRIDNYEILDAVLPVIQKMGGARVESCEVTETRMYVKVVNPRLETEVVPGDIVQAGIIITNSEVGKGCVNIQPLVFRLVCSNGMVVNDAATRKYHAGRANQADENFELFSDATLQQDDKAFLMKVQDTVRSAVDEVRFKHVVSMMREAKEAKMESAVVPQVIELTSKKFSLSQEEGNGVLSHLIQGGDLSLYGLANAVTRHSQDVKSYDRATELESTGYSILTMAPSLWRQMNSVK